jgi:uncharacterized protein GlcG (DUF336 family)
MDGASSRNVHFAEGKAYAAAAYRQTTESLSHLYKERPDVSVRRTTPSRPSSAGAGAIMTRAGRLRLGDRRQLVGRQFQGSSSAIRLIG